MRRRFVCRYRLELPDGGPVLLCADLPKQLKQMLAWEVRVTAAAAEGRNEEFVEAYFGLLTCMTDTEALDRAAHALGGRMKVCEAVDSWVRGQLRSKMYDASAAVLKQRMREAGRWLR